MIKQLIIKNLAIIDDLSIDFEDGFNILTGETGAGKSIIIDAIGLVFGKRANVDLIKSGCNLAQVSALLYIDETKAKLLNELFSLDIEEEIIITRIIYTNGKSIAKLNDSLISISTLSSIASYLIDIHSQHESQYLLSPKMHLSLLDNYIKKYESNFLDAYTKSFAEYKKTKKDLENLKNTSVNAIDVDYLKFQIEELKDYNYTPEDEESIIAEYKNLKEIEKNFDTINEIINYLDSENGAINKLYYATKTLNKLDNEQVNSYFERLESIYYECKDIADDFQHNFDASNFDFSRLDKLSDEITKINRLKRKFHTENLLDVKKEFQEKLDLVIDYDKCLIEAQERLNKCYQIALKEAKAITAIRKTYALKLASNIKKQLSDLYLEKASFKVNIDSLGSLTNNGLDDIQFYMSANLGSELKPLSKIASGGEVSRIMLGIKTLFLTLSSIDIIIFDEIDTGISGKVAMAVGRKMADIGNHIQVLAISHLPQVACNAKNHIFIKKQNLNNITTTQVLTLNKEQKIEEIARLLSGEKITESSLKNAEELLFSK